MRENFPFPNLDNNHESIVNQHIYFTPPSSPLLITYLVNIRRVQLHPIFHTRDIDPAIYEIPLMIRDK